MALHYLSYCSQIQMSTLILQMKRALLKYPCLYPWIFQITKTFSLKWMFFFEGRLFLNGQAYIHIHDTSCRPLIILICILPPNSGNLLLTQVVYFLMNQYTFICKHASLVFILFTQKTILMHIQMQNRTRKKKVELMMKHWLRWNTISPNAIYCIRGEKCLSYYWVYIQGTRSCLLPPLFGSH